MSRFKNDINNWEANKDRDIEITNNADNNFWDEMEGIVVKASRSEENLIEILNMLAGIVPCGTVGFAELNNVYDELKRIIGCLHKKVDRYGIPRLMDSIALLSEKGSLSYIEINNFMEENGFMYRVEEPLFEYLWWHSIEENPVISKIEYTERYVSTISQQAKEELQRARDMLKRDSSERGYKEIVRNCVDAMEAVVKKIGQQEDIKNATKKIVAEELGPKQIIKRGNNIFNLIHELYPDIRHGSTEYSSMTKAEAEYWVEVITAFIRYLIRIKE
ncbi:MAG: hypothetical protein E7272_01585 [Pseudobutyrivibrio ruminis]|uniref:Uncharacterized protein n=1 Tax=Pseudobutyrivibrio ruminis TaxID=46206 RepID=A0A927YPL7_9FIRM|nr:hypothetical protein [Pseudobutyrivibrio ruminis]